MFYFLGAPASEPGMSVLKKKEGEIFGAIEYDKAHRAEILKSLIRGMQIRFAKEENITDVPITTFIAISSI